MGKMSLILGGKATTLVGIFVAHKPWRKSLHQKNLHPIFMMQVFQLLDKDFYGLCGMVVPLPPPVTPNPPADLKTK